MGRSPLQTGLNGQETWPACLAKVRAVGAEGTSGVVLYEPSAIFALSLQILVVRKDTDGKGVYKFCIGTRTTITFDELSNIVVRKYSNILFAIGSCFFKKNRRPCQLQHRLCSVKSISYLVIRKISPPV